jgi:hypothetical protein
MRGSLYLLLPALLLLGCPAGGDSGSADSIDSELSALQDEVDSLSAALAALETRHDDELGEVRTDVEALQQDLGGLDQDLGLVETDLVTLLDLVVALQNGLALLEAEVAALSSVDLAGLLASVTDHGSRIEAIESAPYASEAWVASQGFAAGSDLDALTLAQTNAAEIGTNAGDVAANATDIQTNTDALADLDASLGDLDELAGYVSVDPVSHDVFLEGANLHVRDGSGSTQGTATGLGNLVVGYDEDDGDDKSGSHNLVIGPYHTYSGYGGLVAGYDNALTGVHTSVTGGRTNVAGGSYTSVSGGHANLAIGWGSSVSGGAANQAFGESASVVGGFGLTASSPWEVLP